MGELTGVTAAPTTTHQQTTVVASPSTPGTTNQLERACDTVWEMWRNRQLSDAQYVTAQRYQLDFETITARRRRAIDPERIAEAAPHYRIPPRDALDAAHRFAEVEVTLKGLQDPPGASLIVDTVVGVGWTLRQAGTHVWPSLNQDEAARRAAQALRAGLDAIEEVWS